MKKYAYIFIGLLVSIASCKKSELELYPFNQVETSQAFENEADINLAVLGMYQGIRASGSYYAGTWNIVADVLADNLIINQQGRLTLKTYGEWRYTGNNTYGLFAGGYSIVRRANSILENIEKFPAGAFKDNAKGEALAVRAMTYFDMARVYSKTYTNAGPADSTLPYVVSTDPTVTPSKEPVKGFYDKVIADLTLAATLVNSTNVVGSGIGSSISRFNKRSVNAILSRVLLYKGDYQGVIAAANTVLATSPNYGTLSTFNGIWKDSTDAGVLLKVKMTSIDNVNTQGTNYYQTVSGGIKSEYVVEYNLAQDFASNDIRRMAYIRTSTFNGSVYNNVIKYAGRVGQPAGVVDAKVIRSAEVLLNRAESYFRSGMETEALADLQTLKANRYIGYDATTDIYAGQALLTEILRQRRLELAFEGDRFWDLKRRNAPVERDPSKGDKADGTGTPYVFTTLPAGDPKFNLPYPQSEISFNPNFTQNPGY